jgi:hypothetical protein
MIRSAVDAEFFTDLGIVCIHAHVYTERTADSEALQDQVYAILNRVRDELKAEDRLSLKPDGSVMRAGASKGETTEHGKGKRGTTKRGSRG